MAKSVEPETRIGVYKRLSDVPAHYRLANFEAEYGGRDVWAEYVRDRYPDPSSHTVRRLNYFEKLWKKHVKERGRHHALADPVDIETFCADRLEEINENTLYDGYWSFLEGFYSWLQSHTAHPHVYHPPIIAAIEYPNARTAWDARIKRTTHEEY